DVDGGRPGRAEVLREAGDRVVRRRHSLAAARRRVTPGRGGALAPADGEPVDGDVLDVRGRAVVHLPDQDLVVADVGAAVDLGGEGRDVGDLERRVHAGAGVVVGAVGDRAALDRVHEVPGRVEDVDVVIGLHLPHVERLVPLEVDDVLAVGGVEVGDGGGTVGA